MRPGGRGGSVSFSLAPLECFFFSCGRPCARCRLCAHGTDGVAREATGATQSGQFLRVTLFPRLFFSSFSRALS